MRTRNRGLWHHHDFRNLWLGQTASMLGTDMTGIVLPLLAALTLDASLVEIGMLSASVYVPTLLMSLLAGVWLDRKPKRPIIVLADVGRALLLVTIPLALWQDVLTMPLLIGISLAVGVGSVVSDIGNAAILPILVDRENLIEGNSKLEVSASVSNIGGNTVGGVAISVLPAPLAVILNAVLYAVSAVFTFAIRKEEVPEPDGQPRHVIREIAEGASFVFSNVTLRVLVGATLIANFFAFALDPIFLVYIARTLDLDPFYIGVILSSSGAGALVGALVSGPLSRRLPLGRLLVATTAGVGLIVLLVPLATFMPLPVAVGMLIVMQFLDAVLVIVCNVNMRAYRSSITPDRLQGRMNASVRMVVMGVAPLGAIAGGVFGEWAGVQVGLVVAALGILSAALPIACSHIRHVRAVPEAPVGPKDGIGAVVVPLGQEPVRVPVADREEKW